MDNFEFTSHARDMMLERGIHEEWVGVTLASPERKDVDREGQVHYFKTIPEHGGRVLHVVVNPTTDLPKVITTFFNRGARRMG